jgi:hypothetical protein
MWLIGNFSYRDHHWMNTRGEVLFGLTCTFDLSRPCRRDDWVLWPSDLPAWIAVSFF